MDLFRHLRSFLLPITVAGVVPFFQVARFDPFGLKIFLPLPYLQIPLGAVFFVLGMVLLVATIRMFARVGKGTLAPWDPTQHLVVQGAYAYTRNPMISGVCFLLAGETILCGSRAIGAWTLAFILINTVYFKLFEEPGLVKRFGQEYLTYRANVPMWLPRLTPWRPDAEFPPLETPRLILRAFEERDIEPFRSYRSDAEVARYQGWTAPYSLEQATSFVHEMIAAVPGEAGQPYQIAIEMKSTGEMIGDCMFERLREDDRQAEIGFTLARPFHGQGYGREAVARLVDYLFDDLGLHRIRANCDPENRPSARLLEGVGFRHEGLFVESLWFKGRWADEDWYALLRSEWQAKK